jgi:hypothetical protein
MVGFDPEEVIVIEILLKDIVAEAWPVGVFVVRPDWEWGLLVEGSHRGGCWPASTWPGRLFFFSVKFVAKVCEGFLVCGAVLQPRIVFRLKKAVRSTMMRSKIRVRQGEMLIRRPNNRTEVL